MQNYTNILKDGNQICGSDGGLIMWEKQGGCAINACNCFQFITECNAERICISDANGQTICKGECELTGLGILLLVICIGLVIVAPIAVLAYNQFVSSKSVKSQRGDQSKNSGVYKPDEEASTENEHESSEVKSNKTTETTSAYFDLSMFKEAPSGFVSCSASYDLGIEVSSKGVITSMSYFLLSVFVLCIITAMYPMDLSNEMHYINHDTCTMGLHNDPQIEACNITSRIIDSSHSTMEVYISSNIPMTTSYLSFDIQLNHVIATNLSLNASFMNFDYTLNMYAGDKQPVQNFKSSVLSLCECLPNANGKICQYSTCSTESLVNILRQKNGLILDYAKEKQIKLVIDFDFPHTNSQAFSTIIFGTWKNPVQSVYDIIISVLSGFDVVLFLVWVYTMYKHKQKWSTMLPVRRWIYFLLLMNIIQNNPFVRYSASWYSIRDIWDTISGTIFILFLLLILDSQRKLDYTKRFYWVKVVVAASFASVRIAATFLFSDYVVNIIDLHLVVVAFVIFSFVSSHVGRVLSRQHYIASRSRQLSFRVLVILSYMVISVLTCSVLTISSVPRISNYMPKQQHSGWIAITAMFQATLVVLICMHFPVAQSQTQSEYASYTIRSGRQYRLKSPRIEESGPKKFWNDVKVIVRQDIEDNWIPHSVFCLETACSMFNFSRIAYYQDTNAHTQYMHSLEKWRVIGELNDDMTDTHGFIATNDIFIVISFRGTVTKKNIQTDVDYRFTQLEFEGTSYSDIPSNAKVHRGFLRAYSRIRSTLLELMNETIGELSLTKDKIPVYCTGHSLGGALATLCALDMSFNEKCHVIMYNFGSPRVGNHDFAKFYNTKVPKSFRVVNDGDVIVGGPKREVLGVYFVPGSRYKHIGLYILLDGRGYGDLLIDPNIVERALMAKLKRKPTCHLMSSYKIQLDKCVDVAMEYTSTTHENLHENLTMSDSPRKKFLRSRWISGNWTDVMQRLQNVVT